MGPVPHPRLRLRDPALPADLVGANADPLSLFEIVAHRGAPTTEAPENTIPAFQRALGLGADAVELDIRLTADRVPVVYHYFYLDEITSLSGPIFEYTFEQLQDARPFKDSRLSIPSLLEVLETIGEKIGLEIEIKGQNLSLAI